MIRGWHLATLALMVLIALLVFGTFFRTQIELWVTRNDTTSVQAFYAAEAGLQKYKAALFQQYIWLEQQGNAPEGPGCYTQLFDGIDLDRDGILTKYTDNQIVLAEGENVLDANGVPIGSYTVKLIRDSHNGQIFTLVSQGTSRGARATVQATFHISANVPGIFAGSGQGTRWLNGSATIRGGIYIEGNPLNPEQYVIQSNGNFKLLNDYNLNPDTYSGISDRVEQSYRQVNDLCASLRVRYGKISVGGSTQIGTPDNKVKGVFVGRGMRDIEGQNDVCEKTKGVCAEAIGPFDIANPPPFPTLDSKLNSDACRSYTSWRSCLQSKATLRIQRVGGSLTIPHPPNPLLPPTCLTDLNSVLNPTSNTLTLGSKAVDCAFPPANPSGGFRYTYSGGQGTLEIFGDVVLEGLNLVIGGSDKGNQKGNQSISVNYKAKSPDGKKSATLAVLAVNGQGGNMDLNGNLLPDPDPNYGLYPNHVLGLVVEKNLYQRGQYVMAPVYAGTFRIVKQNVLLGSVITNVFCTTSAGDRFECESEEQKGAGQSPEVVHIRIPRANQPVLIPDLRIPTFQVLSYERR
ncbi:competence protein ComZ [Thermus scotoductus]|uniref:Competence protein ComZ n=2 Tax=Thermus scotoductus TaxID=37636 RepID=A0A430V2E4_THESC|nr:competence protein ComZ [Thermus scotoductus]